MSTQPFDAVSGTYDQSFSKTKLGRHLREIVWFRLADNFRQGNRVLELNCGTGEDALWLAGHGIRVLATDASPGMLQRAREKIRLSDLKELIQCDQLDLAAPQLENGSYFNGALSNFGGLNCVSDLSPIARLLKRWVQQRGRIVLVLMHRWCLWEILWEILHLHPTKAIRRLRKGGTTANVGGMEISVWYPSIRTVKELLAPEFVLKRVTGLGVFLPPSYLGALVDRLRLFPLLDFLEGHLARRMPFSHLGDHVILEFERLVVEDAENDRSRHP